MIHLSGSWGKPFWRRVIPQTPFLNLFSIFCIRNSFLIQKIVESSEKRI